MRLKLIPDPELHPDIHYSPLLDLEVLIFRFLSTAILAYYLLSEQLALAFHHLINGVDWELATFLEQAGIPKSGIFTSVIVLITGVAAIGVAAGFFTRLCALFLTVTLGAVLIFAPPVSPALTPQAILLYLCIDFGIVVGGAGRISLDSLLLGRKSAIAEPEDDFQ